MGTNAVAKQTYSVLRHTILDHEIESLEGDALDALIENTQAAAATNTAKESVNKNGFPLRPSSALKSKRDLYYGLINYYKPGSIPVTAIEGRSCMLLNLGHVIEKHLIENIERAYKLPFKNERVVFGSVTTAKGESIELGGEFDFVMDIEGELVLCDSKSSADYPFKGELPKNEHIAQINLYLHSAWAQEKDIKRAIIWYYNKNNSELKTREFYYDKTLALKTIARFQEVYDAYEKGEIPKREHILGVDWQASYSSFRDADWNEFEATLGARATVTLADDRTLPDEKKALLRHIVTKYGTSILCTPEGRRLWAERHQNTLVLKEEKPDGFSY